MYTKTVTITGEESLLLLPARSKGDFQQKRFTYEESFALPRPRSNSVSFTEAFWDVMRTRKACAREIRGCGESNIYSNVNVFRGHNQMRISRPGEGFSSG